MMAEKESRQDGGMTPEIFTWDWKGEPPMEEIFAAVARASGGRVIMRMHDDGTDQYACIIADHVVTDEEAERVMDAQEIADEEAERVMDAQELRRMT